MIRLPFLFSTLLLASCSAAAADAPAAEPASLQHAMIWLESAPPGKQVWAAFRKTFDVTEVPAQARLRLFSDTRYILYINGLYVDRGPCRFDPAAPEYDELDIKDRLATGQNAIAILVQHVHDGKPKETPEGFYGRAMRHVPGLCAQLTLTDAQGNETTLQTDATWRASATTQYLPGRTNWAGNMDDVDARRAPLDWMQTHFDDSSWAHASPVDGTQWGTLRARRLPLLRETRVENLTLLEWGASRDAKPLARMLPFTLKSGERAVVDASQFVQAYSIVDVAASDGARLELEYAQTYFTSGNNPANSNGHVNTFIAREGRQTYMSTDTFGFKYLVIRAVSGDVTVHNLDIVNRLYPFDVVGSFHSSDPLLNRLWQIGVNTVLACSEDSYVDCATRERVEWLGDAAVVEFPITRAAFAGPGTGGAPRYADPRLLRNALWHIALSQQPDGRVKAHHPSDRWDIHGYIEDYACLWIHAIRAYYDSTNGLEASGEGSAFVQDVWPYVTRQLQWFLDHRTGSGLVKAREFVFPGNPLCYTVCQGTTLNAYVYAALRDAAYLAGILGDINQRDAYAAAAASIQDALAAHLWNPNLGAYHGSLNDDGSRTPPTVHAAMMTLYFDAVPPDSRPRLEQWLLDHEASESVSAYAHTFLLDVLYRMNTGKADRLALDLIRTRWKAMSEGETSTTWEGFGPGEYCHNMGSAPALFLSRYVLGVRVDGPVKARRILIQPRLGGLTEAKGAVVTEFGPVNVAWTHEEKSGAIRFLCTVPENTSATLALPGDVHGTQLTLNGRRIPPQDLTQQGRFFTVPLPAGESTGKAENTQFSE